MRALAPLAIVVPLLVAALLTALQRLPWRRLFDATAILTALVVTTLCIWLIFGTRDLPIVYWMGGWEPQDGMAIGIALLVDPIGAAFAALTAFLTATVLVFSWHYFQAVDGLFHGLVLCFLAGMVGFCLTADLFNLFVFLELVSIAAFALTAYKIEARSPLQGAFTFAVSSTIGAVMILTAIALLYGRTGALNMAQLGQTLAGHPVDGLVLVAFVLITAGLFVKAAIVPFHFWLADAYAVAPTPACVLFSGMMTELGIYGLARIYWTVFQGILAPQAAHLRGVLIGMGILTIVVGSLLCYGQRHLKRLLAFSSVSHAGMLLIAMALMSQQGLAGATIYILSHGMVKGGLFFCSGILLHRFESVDELDLHGRGRDLHRLGILFAMGGLALAGLPPFGTFLGKALMEDATHYAGGAWLMVPLSLASILTAAAVLRVAGRVFWGMGARQEELETSESQQEKPERETEGDNKRSIPLVLIAPVYVMMTTGLLLGLIPGISSWAESAAARFQDRQGFVAATLYGKPTWVMADHPPLAFFLSSCGIGMASAGVATGLALITLFHHRLPSGWMHREHQRLAQAITVFKSVHTGHVGDYVVWIVLGTLVYGILCAGGLIGK